MPTCYPAPTMASTGKRGSSPDPKDPQSWLLASALCISGIQTQFQSPHKLAPIIRWKAVLSPHAPDCLFNGGVGSLSLSISLGVLGREEHFTRTQVVHCWRQKSAAKRGSLSCKTSSGKPKVLYIFLKNRCATCAAESSPSHIKQGTRRIYPRTPSMYVIIVLKPLHRGRLVMKSMDQRPNLLPGIGSGFNRPADAQILLL